MRLPWRGVMLADPGLAEAQLIRPAQLLQVPLVPVEELPLGRVRRHREETVVHDVPPCRSRSKGTSGRRRSLSGGSPLLPPSPGGPPSPVPVLPGTLSLTRAGLNVIRSSPPP